MTAISKWLKAKVIIENLFEKDINSLSLNYNSKKLHVILTDGIEIYIIYNDHDQYGYNILFSKLDLDRYRFDNYDDKWEVASPPHHFHPKKKKEAESSKMTGDPQKDIPYFYKMLKSGKLHEALEIWLDPFTIFKKIEC